MEGEHGPDFENGRSPAARTITLAFRRLNDSFRSSSNDVKSSALRVLPWLEDNQGYSDVVDRSHRRLLDQSAPRADRRTICMFHPAGCRRRDVAYGNNNAYSLRPVAPGVY